MREKEQYNEVGEDRAREAERGEMCKNDSQENWGIDSMKGDTMSEKEQGKYISAWVLFS